MKTQFTSGPWYYESDGDGSPDYHQDKYVCADNGGGRVCTLNYPNDGGNRIIRANGQLIAAAPEMADAILSAIGWLEDKEHADTLTLAGKEALDRFRKVIRKATTVREVSND